MLQLRGEMVTRAKVSLYQLKALKETVHPQVKNTYFPFTCSAV